MEHGLLRRYFAAFSKISGFSNWVIAKAVLELKKPEIKNGCLRTETGISQKESECFNRGGHDADKVKCGLSDCIYKDRDEPTAEILRQKKNYALMSVGGNFLDGSKLRLDIHLIKITSSNENGFNSSADRTMNSNENGFNLSVDKIKNSTANGFNSSADKINDRITDSDAKDKEHISDKHTGVESDGKICDMLFENREIIDFVESVDDKNPIHRNEKAVVPGFLILEKFIEDNYLSGEENDKDIFDFEKRRKENKAVYVSKEEKSVFKIEIKYLLPVFAGERIYLYNDKNMIKGMVNRSGCGSVEDKVIEVFEIKCKEDYKKQEKR